MGKLPNGVTEALALLACLLTGCDNNNDSSPAPSGESSTTGHATETGTSTGGEATLVEDYCTCMLFQCHLHYHDVWGSDEVAARLACLDEASGVPEAGAPQDAGNSLECRLHFCEMSTSEDDPEVCPAALGASPCEA